MFKMLQIIFIVTSVFVTHAAGEAVSPRGWKAAIEEELSESSPKSFPHSNPQQSLPTPPATRTAEAPMLTPPPTPPHIPEPISDIFFAIIAAFIAGIAVGILWHRLASKRPSAIEATDESMAAVERRERLANHNNNGLHAEGSIVKGEHTEEHVDTLDDRQLVQEDYEIVSSERIGITSSQVERSQEISITANSTELGVHGTGATTGAAYSLGVPSHSGLVAGVNNHNHNNHNGGLGENGPSALMEKVGSILASIDTSKMSFQEQLQYCSVAVQANHSHQTQRLKSEENSLRSTHVAIAATAVTHTIAKDEAEEARRRTQDVQQMFADCLAAGLALMAGAISYQAWQGGIFVPLDLRCGAFPRVNSWRWALGWAPWGRSFEVVWCYLSYVGDAVLGIGVLLLAAWVVHGTGVLRNSQSMPIAKLVMGMGIGCGTVGYIAVQKIGGDSWTWVELWALWIVLHTVLSMTAHGMVRRDMRAAKVRPENQRPGGGLFEESVWKGSTAWIAGIA